MTRAPEGDEAAAVTRGHLRFGWSLLLVFLALGILLEALHGFKVPLYLDVSNETRRLMWTLGHAHGALLAIVNIVFAASIPLVAALSGRALHVASRLLMAATVLMPLGFLLGGAVVRGGDPSVGILLVPAGGLCLLVGVGTVAWRTGRARA